MQVTVAGVHIDDSTKPMTKDIEPISTKVIMTKQLSQM